MMSFACSSGKAYDPGLGISAEKIFHFTAGSDESTSDVYHCVSCFGCNTWAAMHAKRSRLPSIVEESQAWKSLAGSLSGDVALAPSHLLAKSLFEAVDWSTTELGTPILQSIFFFKSPYHSPKAYLLNGHQRLVHYYAQVCFHVVNQ